MKIIVFGANGMAGHMVALYLSEQGHEITGFVKKKNDEITKTYTHTHIYTHTPAGLSTQHKSESS